MRWKKERRGRKCRIIIVNIFYVILTITIPLFLLSSVLKTCFFIFKNKISNFSNFITDRKQCRDHPRVTGLPLWKLFLLFLFSCISKLFVCFVCFHMSRTCLVYLLRIVTTSAFSLVFKLNIDRLKTIFFLGLFFIIYWHCLCSHNRKMCLRGSFFLNFQNMK